MNIKTWLARLLICLALAGTAQAADRPSIVLIYADDLGYTDLAIYGSEYHQTPNIDALMDSGMRFTQAYSMAPLCAPARVGMLSGRYPARFGCYEVVNGVKARGIPLDKLPMIQPDNQLRLPEDNNTLAELLKEAGYRCGVFGKWHVGRDLPTARGFDDYVTMRNGSHFKAEMSFIRQSGGYPEPTGYSSDYIQKCADLFLDKNDGRPFFLYLPHTLVHTAMGKGTKPLEPKPELKAKYQALPKSQFHRNPDYAAMMESLDQSVGELVASLKERGIWENTLVIFTSDNGPLLGGFSGQELNSIELGRFTSAYPLTRGKSTLWEGGIRVPMSFTWPGHIEAGTVSDVIVSQVDYLPTLVQLADRDVITVPMDGISLWPLLSGEVTSLPERMLFWHFPGYRMGKPEGQRPASVVLQGDWKLFESLEDGSLKLYNLNEDISELNDLAQEHPERAAKMQTALDQWRKSIDAPMPTPRS